MTPADYALASRFAGPAFPMDTHAKAPTSNWHQRQAAAERQMVEDFMSGTKKPLHLPALFTVGSGWCGKKNPSMYEVLHDTIDNEDFAERAMQFLCDMAQGIHRQADALELLEQMSVRFASRNCEAVE